MYVFNQRAPAGATAALTVQLNYDLRCRSRLTATLADGTEIGIALPRAEKLRDGDLLQSADGRVLAIQAAPESLLEARCADPLAFARAAYHLGNRHMPVQLTADHCLRFPVDHVLAEMLAQMGVETTQTTAPFEPESGAYGKHSHGHDHHPYRPGSGPQGFDPLHDPGQGEHRSPRRIHDFTQS